MTVAERKAKDKADLLKMIASLDSVLKQPEAKAMPEVQAGMKAQIQQLRDGIKAIDDIPKAERPS